jgi:hydrogenase-4 component E
MNTLLSQIFLEVLFGSVVFLHLSKKNAGATMAYGIQSLAIVGVLFGTFLETGNLWMLAIALVTLGAKVIMAPLFFTRLIRKHELTFSVSTYLNTPFTLIVIAILTALAYSEKFAPLTFLVTGNQPLLELALASMFLSLFLIVNRKGALSQVLGILSLENSIVAFSIFAGLEQSPALELGIVFNICLWMIVATVFVSMIYRHFGTLDINSMTSLKD